MAARIEIVHNLSGESGTVILTGYKAQFPLVEIPALREVYTAPHAQETYLRTEPDVLPVMYIMRFWRSSDGISLDTEIPIALAVDASTGAVSPVTRIEYNVDGPEDTDPVSGQNQLRDARLLNKNYWVEERGTGSLFTDEITDRSDDGGGFDFTDPFKNFENGGRYAAYIIEESDETGSGSSPVAGDGVVLLEGPSDDFVMASMGGKLLIAAYTDPVGTLNFAALATIPDCSFRYQTHGGAQNYGVWQLNPGDTVQFMNQAVNKLYFAKGESIECSIVSGVMYVWSYNGRAAIRGAVYGDSNSTRAGMLGNLLLADESTGVLEGNDYPGLLAYVQSLPAGAFVSLALWGTSQVVNSGKINQATVYPNKSKWGITGTQIRVPHLAGMVSKYLASGEAAGRYEHDQVGSFEAIPTLHKGFSYTGSPNNDTIGNGNTGAADVVQQNAKFNTANASTKVINFGEIPYIIL
jgi:hypothetical protein